MLILTRKETETIHIGDDIIITVIRIAGDKVKIGIDAPADVAVHRSEVYLAILADSDKQERGEA